MPDRSAEPLLADDADHIALDLSDLVLDGRAAGGRLWSGRRFVDCTFHDADLRGLVTERCTFDGCRFRGTTSATPRTAAAPSGRPRSSAPR